MHDNVGAISKLNMNNDFLMNNLSMFP